MLFLLTRLLRGATGRRDHQKRAGEISTHTPLARRDKSGVMPLFFRRISTHTPLARRDKSKQRSQKYCSNFYSHASCEARQISDAVYAGKSVISTHTPLARRDPLSDRGAVHYSNFYSHASCEARPYAEIWNEWFRDISTHTPLARRDRRTYGNDQGCARFLLTRLLRGATILSML